MLPHVREQLECALPLVAFRTRCDARVEWNRGALGHGARLELAEQFERALPLQALRARGDGRTEGDLARLQTEVVTLAQ